MVVVIEFLDDNGTSSTTEPTTSVINDVDSVAVVDVVRDGGTVANILWGFGLPDTPTEGMLYIDVS